MPATISPLTAAELSQAAYIPLSDWISDPTGVTFNAGLPPGWVAVPELSTYGGTPAAPDTTVQEIAFANASTGQLVFTFRGSDNVSNFASDFANSGGAAWESMNTAFGNIIQNDLPSSDYAGYNALVDGHSLGGGMAQTAAIEYGLSGYTQNSLPISQTAIQNDIFPTGSFSSAESQWLANGNFLNATNVSGDPATLYYSTVQGQTYINTSTTTLASPYAAMEAIGAIGSIFTGGASLALSAYAAYEAHIDTTVISLLQSQGSSTGDTPTVNSQLATDASAIVNAFSQSTITASGGTVTASDNGTSVTAAETAATSNTDTYSVMVNSVVPVSLTTINGGENQSYSVSNGNGIYDFTTGSNTITVSGADSTVSATNDTVILGSSSSATVIGNGNGVQLASDATVTLTGTNERISVAGNDSVTIGSGSSATITGAGISSLSLSFTDANGVVSAVSVPADATSITATANADGSYSTIADNGNVTVTSSYSASGQIQSSQTVGDAGGSDAGYSSTTSYSYNSDGSYTTTEDDGTNTVTSSYSSTGQIQSAQSVGDAGGTDAGYSLTTNYSYNPDGTTAEITTSDSNGDTSDATYTYSSGSTTINTADYTSGVLTGTAVETITPVTGGGVQSVSDSYDPSGVLQSETTQTINANGSSSSTTTNSDGTYSTAIDNGTDTVTNAYSASGQIQFTSTQSDVDPSSYLNTSYNYNADGTLDTSDTWNSSGEVSDSHYYYDNGVLVYKNIFTPETDPSGYDTQTVESITYNSLGEAVSDDTSLADYGGYVDVSNTYDGDGNLVSSSTQSGSGYYGTPITVSTTYYGGDSGTYSDTTTSVDGQLMTDVEQSDDGTSTTNYTYDDDDNLQEAVTDYVAPDGTDVGTTTQYTSNTDDTETASTTIDITPTSDSSPVSVTATITYDEFGNEVVNGVIDNGTLANYGNAGSSGTSISDSAGIYGYSGGYAFAAGSGGSSGVNVGLIAQYDFAHNDFASGVAALEAQQQANITANSASEPSEDSSVEGAKWGSQVITWSLATSAGPSSAPFSNYISSEYLSTVQAAFATWSAATGITFEQVADSSSSDVRIGWGDFQTSTTGVLGYTGFTQQGSEMTSAIIRLEDPSEDTLVSGADGSETYAGTNTTLDQLLLHEIGHALGLADNSDPTSIMYSSLGTGNSTLTSADIAAAQELYSGGTVVGPASTIDEYNLSGQLESEYVQHANGSTIESTYNALGQLANEDSTSADGATSDSSYRYNEDGSYTDTVVVTPADGGTPTTEVYNYDAQGNLVTGDGSTTDVVDNPDGSTVVYTFNTLGQLISADLTNVDGSTNDATYTYEADGTYVESIVATPVEGGVTTTVYTFDQNDQLLSQVVTNPDGSTVADTFTYAVDGSHTQTEVDTAAGASTSTTTVYSFDASDNLTSQITTNPDGSTVADTFTYAADGSHTQTEVDTAAGASTSTTTVYVIDANGDLASQFTSNPDGSTTADTFTYAADGSRTQTEVDTAAGASTSTTTVYAFDADNNLTNQITTNPDGSTVADTFAYASDGSYTQTEVDTAAGASTSTTTVYSFDAGGDLTSQLTTNPDGSTVADTFTYASDGSYTQTEVDTTAAGSASTTVYAIDANGQVINSNTYDPSSGGSYNDSWSKDDGSSGTYWWDASTREYSDTWTDSNGTTWTDQYQYASGGSPASNGYSYTETYTSSDGDSGTRQYDASTNLTTVTWDSSQTGSVTGTISGDAGFVGLTADGELTNTQNDLTFFNPAASTAFTTWLAAH